MEFNISNLDERKKFANWVQSFIRTTPWDRESLIKPGSIPFVYKDIEEVLNYKEGELEDYIKILRDLLDIDLKYTTSNVALFTPIITLRLIYMILFVMVHKATFADQDTFIFNLLHHSLTKSEKNESLFYSSQFYEYAGYCYDIIPRRTILVIKRIWTDLRNKLNSISRRLMIVTEDDGEIFRNIMSNSKKLAYLNRFILEKLKNEEDYELLQICKSNFPDFVASNAVAENKQLPPVIENKLMTYLRADDSLLTDPYYIANFYIETKSSEHLDEMAKAIDDMAIGSNACVIT